MHISLSDLLQDGQRGDPFDFRSSRKLAAEDLAILLPEVTNGSQRLLHRSTRPPPSVARELRIISDVNELIAGARTSPFVIEVFSRKPLDLIHQFEEGNRVLRPASDVVNLAGGRR